MKSDKASSRKIQWGGLPFHSLSWDLQQRFGKKLYKLSLDGGMTCPNRDGTLGRGGCIFCSAGGSGDFAAPRQEDLNLQIQEAKAQIAGKAKDLEPPSYIAYFQSYTNTYAPLDHLEKLFFAAAAHPDTAVLSIATRPDCLAEPVIALLSKVNQIKPVWVELGLQTIHERAAEYIRRGYPLSCFEEAAENLRSRGIEVIVHTILGLPGESREDICATMEYLNEKDIQGVKLQLLHVLKGTDLAYDYAAGKFRVFESEEYLDVLIACLERLRPEIVIHRITGDGPKELLLAPLWASRKREVLNLLHRRMKELGSYQGKQYISLHK